MPRKRKIIEEDNSPKEATSIELKELEGIGPISEKKLRSAGMENLLDFALRSPHEISSLLSYKDDIQAEKWCSQAKKVLEEKGIIPPQTQTAYQIYEYRKTIP